MAELVCLSFGKWERATDTIPAKLQVIGNLTLKGKENPSKETLCPLISLGFFKTKASTWDAATDRKDGFAPVYKVNIAGTQGLHIGQSSP